MDNPQPGCYLREIPAQPHTKFIGSNKGILDSLLSVLIGEHIFKEGACFEERFNIKTYKPPVDIRLLDQQLTSHFSGVSCLGLPVHELAKVRIPCKRVIIMENKASYNNIENFLTLPQLTGTIAIFGGGHGVNRLRQVRWLEEMEIYYWGDIDVQGFEILSAVRSMFKQTRSLMMDRETFHSFASQHTTGPKRSADRLNHLNNQESELYNYLKGLAENNRLEQESIPNLYVIQRLQEL